jgi:hypothetical protein
MVDEDVEGCHGKPEGYDLANHACYLDYLEETEC